MGMGGGGVGGIFSLAGAGASAYGDIIKGQGEKAADDYQADTDMFKSNITKVEGIQDNAKLSMQLNQALGNIDTVRAASHDDPTSPTGSSIRDTTEFLGNENKQIAADQSFAQQQIYADDSKYMHAAGQYAMKAAEIGAAGSILSGLGGLM